VFLPLLHRWAVTRWVDQETEAQVGPARHASASAPQRRQTLPFGRTQR
jgi:hypothetical protein